MPARRSKPITRWEPAPFLALLVLLLFTGIVRPEGPPVVFWGFMVLVAGAIGWLIWSLVRSGRRENPDQWGDLSSLEGLEVVDAPQRSREVRAVVPVDDTHRHQPAIELARLHGGTEQSAVLVPRASRWLSRRYRIGVQLVGDDHPRHAGFLGRSAEDRWTGLLDGLRDHGRYVRVPALITGAARPFGVELDLSGLDGLAGPGGDA